MWCRPIPRRGSTTRLRSAARAMCCTGAAPPTASAMLRCLPRCCGASERNGRRSPWTSRWCSLRVRRARPFRTSASMSCLRRASSRASRAGPPIGWTLQPCIGTATVLQWKLTAKGKLFHSGLPHKAVNSIELAMDAVSHLQRRFYETFPPHADEARYNFSTPSTLKPTQIECAAGSLNQIPPHCTVQGDARVTPFYSAAEVVAAALKFVEEFNEAAPTLECRGPASRYVIRVPGEGGAEEEVRGRVELSFDGDMNGFRGIACDLDSPGYKALCNATESVLGEVKPYSICGSLPLVKQLQEGGLDVQICGYGKSHVYHGDDEYCLLSDMCNAMRIFSHVLTALHNESKQE
eukprot:TRINITY_DN1009_c0_g1_i3.p1 TRINITY_DN1009_c0_g1~~TRINITY_DN1009_c0_g1_i3.p1  ORF type:complete len:350 (-),score=84.50 TRINITY_DN1009_c0_g1_i3:216-1265(-)